jgi:hypothetical protein
MIIISATMIVKLVANDEFFYLGAGGDHVNEAPCTMTKLVKPVKLMTNMVVVVVVMSIVMIVEVMKTKQAQVRGGMTGDDERVGVVKIKQAKVRG